MPSLVQEARGVRLSLLVMLNLITRLTRYLPHLPVVEVLFPLSD